jgi:hypothetical protein
MTKDIVLKDKAYELQKPSQMAEMATALKKHIISNGLYTEIQSKNYVHVDGWQLAGGLLGATARIVEVKNLSTEKEVKWFAEAEVFDLKTGDILGRGFAICSKNEGRKKSFDEYAVLSMAQTRAIGKAYRNSIGWIFKLAGYETTPAEEMPSTAAPTEDTAQALPDITQDEMVVIAKQVNAITAAKTPKELTAASRAIKTLTDAGSLTTTQVDYLRALHAQAKVKLGGK